MNKPFKQYLKSIDAHCSEAYKIGRQFEYSVMGILRSNGWHTMRRFGSHGVYFCALCGNNIKRGSKSCPHCTSTKNVMKASLDLTAYKDGCYLMITCKFSDTHTTTIQTDPYWQNMISYANLWGAIPVFAGVRFIEAKSLAGMINSGRRETYFVNLITQQELKHDFLQSPFPNIIHELGAPKTAYKNPSTAKVNPDMATKMKKEAWDTIEYANKVLAKVETDSPAAAKWGTIKTQMMGVLVRMLQIGGLDSSTKDDLAELLKTANALQTQIQTKEIERSET